MVGVNIYRGKEIVMNQKLISWSDFLYIGLAFAVMLSVRGEYQDSFYMLIPVAVFFLLTGVKENVGRLTEFIKKFPIFAVLTVIWTLYYAFVENSGMKSYRYAATVFFIVFAGYAAAMCEKKELSVAFDRLWTVLFVLLLTGVVNYVIVREFGVRMHMFFLNPIPEGDAALVLALISLFYISDRRRKAAGVLLSVVVMIVAQLRHDTLLLLALLVIYAVIRRAEIKAFIGEKILRSRKGALITGLTLAAVVAAVALLVIKGARITALQALVQRFTNMFAATTKDVYLNYYGDHGLRFRVADLDLAINVFRNGGVLKRLFGGGVLYTYYKIKPMAELLVNASGGAAGPVENSFIALLSDYGAFAFILYTGVYVSTISTAIKSKTKSLRIQSLFLIFIMSVSAFSDMHYWTNIAFLIFVLAGVYLGELVKADEKKALYPALLFCAFLALFLYAMPILYSWMRTVITASVNGFGVFFTMFVFALAVVALLVALWNISVLGVSYVSDKKAASSDKMSLRNNYVSGIAGAAVLLLFFVFGTVQIAGAKKYVTPRIDAEKEILSLIIDNAKGSIYTDTYPYLYKKKLGSIKSTLFSGASLGAQHDTTVIMDVEDEAQVLSNAGFLYTPISKWDVVYTNDAAVQRALQEKGYLLTGYCTKSYSADLESGEYFEIYPGKYTATFALKLMENLPYSEDYQVCTLKLAQGKEEDIEEIDTEKEADKATVKPAVKDIATVPVMRSSFDENGECSVDMAFSAGGKDYSFRLLMDSDDKLELKPVEYTRTPDYDTHIVLNEKLKNVHEEYFDLEGEPIEISGGYHGLDYEYNDAGIWNMRRFLNLDLEPVVSTSGYAEIRRNLDGSQRVTREEYYGADGKPIALAQGQAAVEYEYDDNGNRTVDRYYDTEFKPVLYNVQFYYVRRTYDDKKHNILEEYFGTDEKPVLLSDGAAGYRREYDEDGNVTLQTYLGEDGSPALNTSGYAILRRAFDKDKRVLKEEYLDEAGAPIELAKGQASVEYEYDENGNRTVERYFDAEGNPVLFNGQYYCVKRTYNDKNQNILEEYLGTDEAPIALSDGACGYRREYDSAGNVTVTEYLGADGKPVLNTSGYAILRRAFDDKKQITREDYHDEADKPIALNKGQAAVEYEYDDAGNRTVYKYFDAENSPVLYNGQYWYLKVEFNDKKQNILEKYFGTDGNPIYLSDGAAGYRRGYDEAGNVNVLTYLDGDGNPTMNTSAYSTWRRSYNDKKQIVREEYYDTQDSPIALAQGQGAVEYEYDDAGNRTTDRYYDPEGNPTLYAGEFWYIVRTYNDKKQNVHEDYFDLDGKPILRPAGYSSVDIRYNEAGAVAGMTYYDLDGNVVSEE